MRKRIAFVMVVCGTMILSMTVIPCGALEKANTVLLVDSFDDLTTENNLGGVTQGDEATQGCIPSFIQDREIMWGHRGASLQLVYDVSIPGTFTYYWTRLGIFDGPADERNAFRDLSAYRYFSFWYRPVGEVTDFFIEVHKEIDGDGEFYLGKDTVSKISVGKFLVGSVSDEWQKVVIPFTAFPRIGEWKNIYEIVFVFENSRSVQKGDLLVDDLLFGSLVPEDLKPYERVFPGRMKLMSCSINDTPLGTGGMPLRDDNKIQIVLNEPHALLERIDVELSDNNLKDWTICGTFFADGMHEYVGTFSTKTLKTRICFLRLVSRNVLGRESILAGPYRVELKN